MTERRTLKHPIGQPRGLAKVGYRAGQGLYLDWSPRNADILVRHARVMGDGSMI
jgi:hypothetical protein